MYLIICEVIFSKTTYQWVSISRLSDNHFGNQLSKTSNKCDEIWSGVGVVTGSLFNVLSYSVQIKSNSIQKMVILIVFSFKFVNLWNSINNIMYEQNKNIFVMHQYLLPGQFHRNWKALAILQLDQPLLQLPIEMLTKPMDLWLVNTLVHLKMIRNSKIQKNMCSIFMRALNALKVIT